jgi:hypothetical protein
MDNLETKLISLLVEGKINESLYFCEQAIAS